MRRNIQDRVKSLERVTRDIILIDQRGVGGSNPLSCPALGDVSLLEGEKLAFYYESCLKELDTDLRLVHHESLC